MRRHLVCCGPIESAPASRSHLEGVYSASVAVAAAAVTAERLA
jgi:hypothetical protein